MNRLSNACNGVRSRAVSFLQGRHSGSPRLRIQFKQDRIDLTIGDGDTIYTQNCSSTNETEIHAALDQMLREHVLNGSKLDLILGENDFLIRNLAFPTTDTNEINNMVPFQLAKLLPLPLNEFIIQHRINGFTPEGQTKIQMFAVRRSLVEWKIEALQNLGFEVERVQKQGDPVSGDQSNSLDFLPPVHVAKRGGKIAKALFLRTTILCVFCLILGTALVENRISVRENQLRDVYSYLNTTEPAGNRLVAMGKKMNDSKSETALEKFEGFTTKTPGGVFLHEVTFNNSGDTMLLGHAVSPERALDFVVALRALPRVSSAILEFAGTAGNDDNPETQFGIRITY